MGTYVGMWVGTAHHDLEEDGTRTKYRETLTNLLYSALHLSRYRRYFVVFISKKRTLCQQPQLQNSFEANLSIQVWVMVAKECIT